MPRQKYSDDYDLVTTTDEKGREKRTPVYHGKYYDAVLKGTTYASFRAQVYAGLVLIVALQVLIGFINNQGSRQLYVSVPYAIAFFPVMLLVLGAVQMPAELGHLRRDQVEPTFGRMKSSLNFLLIMLAVSFVGEAIFLLFFLHQNPDGLEFAYLGAIGLEIAAAFFLIRLQNKLNLQVQT